MKLDKSKWYNVLLEILLGLIAISLLLTIGVIRFIYAYVKYIITWDWKWLWHYQRKINIWLDEAWNTIGWPFNNRFMRQKWWYKFWRSDETLSSSLGKNERDWTLRPMWKVLVKLLNKLDYNHSIKSIESFNCEINKDGTNN